MTRSLIAVTAGSVAAFLAYWFGAVVALIAMHGIPLGSAGGAPATADIAVHLGLAAIATFGGSRLTFRFGRTAFGGASSSWPRWFGFAIAAASCAGAIAAVWWRTPAATGRAG